jgi:hypothetical protein
MRSYLTNLIKAKGLRAWLQWLARQAQGPEFSLHSVPPKRKGNFNYNKVVVSLTFLK